jgi:hypothetical protein
MIHFIAGLIGLVAGAYMVVKTEKMLDAFGRVEFFEQHLGTEGGSRLGYKLIGLLFIFISILLVTGLFNGFMEWLVSPLTQYTRRQ